MDVKGRGRVVRLEGDPFLQVCFMFDHFLRCQTGQIWCQTGQTQLEHIPLALLAEGRKEKPMAMVGDKRERAEPAGQSASGISTESSKKGRLRASDKRIVECTICGKACSASRDLTTHMRTPSGDLPYACTTCGMALSHSSSLTRHMRTHSGDRPYVCTTCDQAFSQSGTLMTHIRTHSGDIPYVYTTCR